MKAHILNLILKSEQRINEIFDQKNFLEEINKKLE